MQTLHSVLKRGGLYWDRDVLPAAAFGARFKHVQAAVAQSGDDAWLIFGDVARYGSIAYVTNFMPRVRSALVYVPADGVPVLFANIGKRDVPAAKTLTWVDEVRPFGRLPAEVIAFCKERELTKARIGLTGFDASMPITDWLAIEAALPDIRWQRRDGELAALRASKQDWEIGAIRRAATILDNALAQAPVLMRAGISLRTVIAGIDRVARAGGAEDVRYLVAGGARVGSALRPVDDQPLAAGDTVILYAAIQAQRYWAETARTCVLGEAPNVLRALHDRAACTVAAMAAAAVAGAPVRDLALKAEGIAARCAYGWGNAIGLDSDEAPNIGGDTSERLADGATLALRAILHDNGLGAAVAQTVAVHGGRAVPLNTVPPIIEIT